MRNIVFYRNNRAENSNSSDIDIRLLEAVKSHLDDPRNSFIRASTLDSKFKAVSSQKIGIFLSKLEQEGYIEIYDGSRQKCKIYRPSDLQRLLDAEISEI